MTTHPTMSTIPSVDVSLLHGTVTDRQNCAEQIGRACREIGFFHIVNHGISPRLRAQVFDIAQRFFARDLGEKMDVALSADSGYVGYFPLKGEVTDPAAGGDPKEGYDISFAGDAVTRWPVYPTETRDVLTEYFNAVADLGRTLSRGFALALDLPEDFFAAKIDQPTAILRLLHYPPVDKVFDPTLLPPTGCGAHSDYGYLTILAQDSQGGLQVQDRAGQWVDVPPIDNAYVCNIGEMMSMWTNDRFRATLHRVTRVKPEARYSIPFFFHPNPDVLIETLPTCVDPGKPLPPPITSGDYLQRRQVEAYAG